MIGALLAFAIMAAISASTYLILGKHWAEPEPALTCAGRPFGAVAPSAHRRCPICASAEWVLAPGGAIPPCPCLSGQRSDTP